MIIKASSQKVVLYPLWDRALDDLWFGHELLEARINSQECPKQKVDLSSKKKKNENIDCQLEEALYRENKRK